MAPIPAPSQIRRAALAATAAASLLAMAAPAAAQNAVVVFDQSLSGSRGEPVLAERLAERLARDKAAASVTVAGFDEDLTLDLKAAAPRSREWRDGIAKLRHQRGRERHADFEPAFRHLAENLGGAVAVLISHGAPEVWDSRLDPMIKADDRYRHLNDQYRELLLALATRAELADLLGPAYRERNAVLTKEAAARLRPIWGERLVVWDVSGGSAALKEWSEAAGARYLAVAATGASGLPAELERLLTQALAAAKPAKPQPPAPSPKTAPVAEIGADATIRPWMHLHPRDPDPSPPAKAAPRIAVLASALPVAAPPEPPPAEPPPPLAVAAAEVPAPAPAPSAPPIGAIATALVAAAALLVAAGRRRRVAAKADPSSDQ